jgi:hypothetical protein
VDTLSEDEEDIIMSTGESISVSAQPTYTHNSDSDFIPTPGGPFSALTPSMWPQNILSKLTNPVSIHGSEIIVVASNPFNLNKSDHTFMTLAHGTAMPVDEKSPKKSRVNLHMEYLSEISSSAFGRSCSIKLAVWMLRQNQPFAVGRLHFPTASSGVRSQSVSGPELLSCWL